MIGHTHKAHTHTHTCIHRDTVVVVWIFFSLFTLQKGRARSCRTDRRTNITKILQFVKSSSPLSASVTRGRGRPG